MRNFWSWITLEWVIHALDFLRLLSLRCKQRWKTRLYLKITGQSSITTSPYTKLKQTGDQIRLIRLQPGKKLSPIYASLILRSLRPEEGDAKESEHENYEALSYVWGDSKKKRYIFLNGKRFPVTANLEAALRQIRRTDDSCTLWVDAICINQDDVDERNHQVVLMDGIYSKAKKVLVWLGPRNSHAKRALEFVASMNNNHHIRPCDPKLIRGAQCPNNLSSLCAILSQSWWDRTWTLQEILLARDAEMICGNYGVHLQDLFQAFANAEEHYFGKGCCSNIPRCSECRKQYFSFREHVGGLYEQRKRLKESQGLNLFDLLPQYRYRQASQLHDKVYALLGLVDTAQSSRFDPDYECTVEELCIKTAVCNISWCRSLRSLNYAADTVSPLNLPSWVTDWTAYPQSKGVKTALQTRYEMYNAAKDIEWSGTFRGMGKEPYIDCTFSTDGILFDKVDVVGDLCEFERLELAYPACQQWQGLLDAKYPDIKQQYIGGGTIKNCFWRTLTGDVVVSSTRENNFWYERASDVHEEVFNTWWNAVNTGASEAVQGSGMSAFLENITTAIARRRFFVTKGGYIGNGPASTRSGDEVFILCGGKMPLVLRPDLSDTFQEGHYSEAQPRHILIGDSYVHGIMDGEASLNFHDRAQRLRIK